MQIWHLDTSQPPRDLSILSQELMPCGKPFAGSAPSRVDRYRAIKGQQSMPEKYSITTNRSPRSDIWGRATWSKGCKPYAVTEG